MNRYATHFLQARAFTLTETLVVVALLAVLAVAATPGIVAWRARDQVDARARVLLGTFAYARSEAVRRGARVTVCRADAGGNCLAAGAACPSGAADWSCGWAVTVTQGGAVSALRIQAGLPSVSVSGALTAIAFTPPAGQAIGSLRNFELSPRPTTAATSGNRWRRCIRIAAGGRARMTEGACGASS